MTIELVPMTPDQFAPYLDKLIIEYAEESVIVGRWSAEESLAKSRDSVVGSLPEGVATPDNYLWIAHDAATGERVGVLWLQLRATAGTTEAFIDDIEVEATHRGQGYGRAILDAVERWAREQGATRIGLQVAGHNTVARRLYQSFGFTERSIMMTRDL